MKQGIPSLGSSRWIARRRGRRCVGLRCTLGYDPTFSDFKSRGFQLEDSQLEHADRLEWLILIMALAMHWYVRIGQDDALQRPASLKKTNAQTDLKHWSFKKLQCSMVPWFTRGLRYLNRCLQNNLPLPNFSVVLRN